MGSARVVVPETPAVEKLGHERFLLTDILTVNYATGGDTLTPESLGFEKILFSWCEINVDGTYATYVRATEKLKCFTTAGAEAANASGNTYRMMFVGL